MIFRNQTILNDRFERLLKKDLKNGMDLNRPMGALQVCVCT